MVFNWGVSNRWTPLDHGTELWALPGLFDWNMGLDWNVVYRNTPAMHARDR